MKAIKFFVAIAIAFITSQAANAQSDKTQREVGIKTQNIKVSGTCDMDKKRIESVSYSVDGVKTATWNQYTQLLTLKYSVFKKDAADKVQKKIALSGNDTEKYSATDVAYNSLPACCQYTRMLSKQ